MGWAAGTVAVAVAVEDAHSRLGSQELLGIPTSFRVSISLSFSEEGDGFVICRCRLWAPSSRGGEEARGGDVGRWSSWGFGSPTGFPKEEEATAGTEESEAS